jgi:hypothetical protein
MKALIEGRKKTARLTRQMTSGGARDPMDVGGGRMTSNYGEPVLVRRRFSFQRQRIALRGRTKCSA